MAEISITIGYQRSLNGLRNCKLIVYTHFIILVFIVATSRALESTLSDIAMFIAFLAITIIYPLWGDISGREEKQNKASYIFATGRVAMVPMMLSIARGTLSVRAILGK